MRFASKTVLIVGAASGRGAAAARAFSDEGATLVLVDRDAGISDIAAALPAATAITGDATLPTTASDAMAAGMPDILFHVACIDPLSATDVPGTSLADWHTILAVNLTSAFVFAQSVLPLMIARGAGSLLITASIAGLKPTPREAAYAVSKAGLIQLARAIALDHARDGIRANALCPEFLESVMADRKATMGR